MNIKILDSWLREYLDTKATPKQIAEKLSLTSVSIERIEKYKNDYAYDIEVTTNRPELMSVTGIAKEAATVLPQFGIEAKFTKKNSEIPKNDIKEEPEMTIKSDPKLIRRILAVVIEVKIKQSPTLIKDRLEASDIRSINSVIDVTNYVMREIGHPTHVFDYDRLLSHQLIVRESRPGEKLITLDGKVYTLFGEDIVADDGNGEIVDLLGVMGTANSVVTNSTKRILFFMDTVEPNHIRKTSMSLGIRTEAAILNEKGLNPELAQKALIRGIKLFEEIADGKVISKIIDIYHDKPKERTIVLTEDKINKTIGIKIPLAKSIEILKSLDFAVEQKANRLEVTVPAEKSSEDMMIPEDLIEEIARVYGYHNIPNKLPEISSVPPFHLEESDLYFEDRVKDALKYWGFTEVYTYAMVSEELYEGPIENAVTIKNPLNEELAYMRRTIIPSLLKVVKENKTHDQIMIFEIANTYEKRAKDLPSQILKLAGIIKKPNASFYEVKGIIEQVLKDLGIESAEFKHSEDGTAGIYIDKNQIGNIEVLDDSMIDFELNFETILEHATLKKIYIPTSIYPSINEDLTIIASESTSTGELIETIKNQNALITEVTLLDKFKDTRTFHIIYQSKEKNLKNEDIAEIRIKILKALKKDLGARIKE